MVARLSNQPAAPSEERRPDDAAHPRQRVRWAQQDAPDDRDGRENDALALLGCRNEVGEFVEVVTGGIGREDVGLASPVPVHAQPDDRAVLLKEATLIMIG